MPLLIIICIWMPFRISPIFGQSRMFSWCHSSRVWWWQLGPHNDTMPWPLWTDRCLMHPNTPRQTPTPRQTEALATWVLLRSFKYFLVFFKISSHPELAPQLQWMRRQRGSRTFCAGSRSKGILTFTDHQKVTEDHFIVEYCGRKHSISQPVLKPRIYYPGFFKESAIRSLQSSWDSREGMGGRGSKCSARCDFWMFSYALKAMSSLSPTFQFEAGVLWELCPCWLLLTDHACLSSVPSKHESTRSSLDIQACSGF